MNNNSLVLKSFIKQLDLWVTYITTNYNPKDTRFVKCKLFFESIKMANPKLLLTVWKKIVTVPYKDKVYMGNIDFFLNKDYNEDLSVKYKTDTVDKAINDLRTTVRNMKPEYVEESIKYMQNLCKLSELYN